MALVRKLLPLDASALRAHLFRLDRESRTERFNGAISDDSLERHCATIDWKDNLLIGWFEEVRLRAVAHLTLAPKLWPREAELAISVEPGWRDRGIGSALCREALLSARDRLISRVCVICMMENHRMRNIVRRLGGSLVYLDGAVEGELRLPPPITLPIWQEAFGADGALVGTLADRWRPVRRDDLPPSGGEEVRAGAPPPAA